MDSLYSAEETSKSVRKLPASTHIHNFSVGQTLGCGSFGRARIATHIETGTVWAIKILKKQGVIDMQQVEHILAERALLKELDHPFIVNLAATFQDETHLYLVMEYVPGGEFFTHLRNAHMLSNSGAQFYAAQVTLMFEYLHDREIIYRDLKPENLLLDAHGYLKLIDFGFAKQCTEKTYTLCGTPEYLAPEILLNQGHNKGVDYWTLGILLYEMLCGEPPFVADDPLAIYRLILDCKISFPDHIERGAKSLIRKLLQPDLTKRYGCLRGGARDIMCHRFFRGVVWTDLLEYKLAAPIIPTLSGEMDTSNFDDYSDSDEEAPMPVYEGGKDPFVAF
jgi:serine/threonine protein kinase